MMLNDCRRHVRVDYPYERERDQFGGDLLTLKARVEPIDEFRKKMLKPRLVYLLSRQTLPRLAATFIQSNYLDRWRMLYIEMSNRYDFSQHWPSDRLKAAT